MKAATVVIVVLGLALSAILAIAVGVDVTGVVILGFLVGVGLLAIAIARKSGTGAVTPAECRACGGLISPNAPYCKHCGVDVRVAT